MPSSSADNETRSHNANSTSPPVAKRVVSVCAQRGVQRTGVVAEVYHTSRLCHTLGIGVRTCERVC
eukprot:2917613-Rhodomonas_salina.1